MGALTLGSSRVADALSRPDLAANNPTATMATPPVQGFSSPNVTASLNIGNTANFQGRISLIMLGTLVAGMMAFTYWTKDFQK